jgi:ABC-type glutathione transport system ATPase component
MSAPLLELTDLCIRTHDRVLVDGVSLVARSGRVTAVVGASGSGKTLTARAAMGVLDVVPGLDRGSLRYPALSDVDWFDGVRGGGMKAQLALRERMRSLRGAYVTYSPQSASSALNPGRTIGRQLASAVARRRTPTEDVPAAVLEVLGEVGLPPRAAHALPGELSGGMAQRAAVAIAIAPLPTVMIADEPETGLDPVLRRLVTELMLDVARRHGVGLVLITHNADTVERVADEVVRVGRHP